MTITPTTLTRAAGVAAVAAGLIFLAVQINHPPMVVASVTTTEWTVRNSMKALMSALALAGITGMYLRQVRQTGVLGLIGYLVFGAGYLVMLGIEFVATFVLPSLAATAPAYVNDVLAAAAGTPPLVDVPRVGRERRIAIAEIRVDDPQRHHTIRARIRQRPQEDGVDEREDGGARADTEGEHGDGHQRRGAVTPQEPHELTGADRKDAHGRLDGRSWVGVGGRAPGDARGFVT